MLLLFIIYITSCYSYLQIIPKDETIKIFQKIGSNDFCGYVIISVIVKMSKVILLKRLTYKLIRG